MLLAEKSKEDVIINTFVKYGHFDIHIFKLNIKICTMTLFPQIHDTRSLNY